MLFHSGLIRFFVLVVTSVLLVSIFVCSLFGQSLSETWNVPSYRPSDYSEFYGNVYFSNSMEEWDTRVEEVLSASMSQWLENADRMVEQLLSEENGEDAFISNTGYLDERMRSLYSEVSVLFSEWERTLTDDYFDHRNAFLHKLETGKVDALYFQRIGQEALYKEYTEEERALIENRNRILESSKEWEYEWNETKQEGLDSFASSLADLQTDYDDYVRSLQETDLRFSENLNAINLYKETIRTALREIVLELKVGLDSSCTVTSGCQYKNFDGSYNEAGKIFSKFIGELSDELNHEEVDPDSILTSISSKIRNFLSEESNKAFAEHTFHQGRIYTYQTGFQINLGQSKSSFDLGAAEWRIRNQTYYDVTSDMRYENWLYGGTGEIGRFSMVYDAEMQGIFQSIHHGDYGRLTSIINSKLGGGRSVQSLISANLYTDAFHFINNDQFGDFYVPFDEAHHTQGNLMLDGQSKYGYWIADRYITILTPGRHSFQMGAIGYSLLYEMFDENSLKTSLYWKENSSQLGGQYNHFQNTLLPAVSHWESKVKEYASSYEDWKENRQNLLEEAALKLESNRQELERSKEEWLSRLEEEKRDGVKSWVGLYGAEDPKEINSPSITPWTPNQNLKEMDRTTLTKYLSLSSVLDLSSGVQVGGVSFMEELQRTIAGVSQYASVIQTNSDLEEFQRSEQKKLIYQMTYGINWESLGGRSLTKEEQILLGNYDTSLLSQEELSRFGSCYEDPNVSSCKSLLKKEFEASLNSDTGVLTLRKEIHNGLLNDKNKDGEYNPGKTEEVRHIQLSSLEKVHLPMGKDLFSVWTEEDWNSLNQSKSKVIDSFLTNALTKDKKSIGLNVNSIHERDNRNQELFLARKEAQEKTDSLIQELALAYFTGGAAGMRASLKGKVESTINGELAKAWITATGGSASDIQMATMAIDFMRGRMTMDKIKSTKTFVGLDNPLEILNPLEQLKLTGQVTKAGLQHTKTALISSMDFLNNATGGVFGAVMNTFVMLPTTIIGNAIFGKNEMDRMLAQKNAQANRIKEIKANEVSIAKSAASQAIARATGLPIEVVSAGVGDFASSRDAKKARRAIEKNPITNALTNVYGVAGGITKSALMAVGFTESELQHTLLQANQMGSSTSLNQSSAELASLGLVEKSFTMSATGTSFQSQLLNIKDKDRVIEELGKRALADKIAATLGIDPKIAKGFLDKGYSDYKTRESDKKAQSKAIEQTAITAASVLITMGASSALTAADAAAKGTVATTNAAATTATAATTTTSSLVSTVGSTLRSIGQSVSGFFGVTTNARNAIQIGEAIANATVQGVAGSKNGMEGVLAGIGNGLLGGVMKSNLLKGFKDGYLGGMTPGLGLTYSPDHGWGGMIGIGNTTSNVNVTFSRKGNTTVQGSYSLGKSGYQIAGDLTTNGAANLGLNYNPTGEGTRRDWNFSLMYDLAGTGLSASVGYTDPVSTLGLRSTLGHEGLSTSAELTGVNIATNGPNGFQLDEMNFAEQNINSAQDKTQDDQNPRPDDLSQAADGDLLRDLANAGTVLAGLLTGGAAIATGLFGGNSNPSNPGPSAPMPPSAEAVVSEGDRKRKEEERGEPEELDVYRSEKDEEVFLSYLSTEDKTAYMSLKKTMYELQSKSLVTDNSEKVKITAEQNANISAFDKALKEYALFIEKKTVQREKNQFGEIVFTQKQIAAFLASNQPIILNGEAFRKEIINGVESFVREKKGELQALTFREDGKIRETMFTIKEGIFGNKSYTNPKTKLFDAAGKPIDRELGYDTNLGRFKEPTTYTFDKLNDTFVKKITENYEALAAKADKAFEDYNQLTDAEKKKIKPTPENGDRIRKTIKEAFKIYDISTLDGLTGEEKQAKIDSMYKGLTKPSTHLQGGNDLGLKLQMSAIVEYLRNKYPNGEGFEFSPSRDLKGNDLKAFESRFKEIKKFLFDSKTSAELGNKFGDEICKVFSNYGMGVMNGHFQGSFAQYMETTLKMGDVDFSKGVPIVAQNRIIEGRYFWDPPSKMEHPVSDSELNAKLKNAYDAGRVGVGSVVQIDLDTSGDGKHNHFTLGIVYRKENGDLSIKINDHAVKDRLDGKDWLDVNNGEVNEHKKMNVLRLITTDVKEK
ncbi:TIGR04388 family protein [Leptospira brenneri]|uniref:TIGR04388 family protein n=1 Tax=Leptospira brenneri TaxID=2023182 RepID=A0A5F1ZBY7_9LEPT|nr:TIGR04388 family protein [Leptospira brenneri]TGK97019.1 TIGR04388 family protein [Leptospira brenneri]